MNCTEMMELVEPIAAGDLEVDPAARAHVESCPRCASALATARRVEAVLAGTRSPAAPDHFAAAVLQRIRRDRWRAEEHVDRLFNVAMAVAIVLVVGGVLALLNLGGFLAAVTGMWALLSETGATAVRNAVPALHTYLAAAGLLLSALAMWWWADRTLNY